MTDTLNILSKVQTLQRISTIKQSTTKLRENIQAAVIGALAHAAEFGDLTLCTKLVQAVSAPHATQLRKYITAHAPAQWNRDKGFTKRKRGGQYRVADAMGIEWDKFEPMSEARAASFDCQKAITSLLGRLDKESTKALLADDSDALSMYVELGEILARYQTA